MYKKPWTCKTSKPKEFLFILSEALRFDRYVLIFLILTFSLIFYVTGV